MVIATRTTATQHGQVLPLAALIIAILVILVITGITVTALLFHIGHIENSTRYAAEIAARPDGTMLGAGYYVIDEVDAKNIARAEIVRSLSRIGQAIKIPDDQTLDEYIENQLRVEVVNPYAPGTPTYYFDDDLTRYEVPAVKVEVKLPVRLLLFDMTVLISRQAIASSSATDEGTPLIQLPEPTIAQLPTKWITMTPGPSPTPIVPTSTPKPTNTSTPTPTNTSAPVPMNTSTPTPTNTSTLAPRNTSTPTPTNTNTPKPTNTSKPINTPTRTPTKKPPVITTPIVTVRPTGAHSLLGPAPTFTPTSIFTPEPIFTPKPQSDGT